MREGEGSLVRAAAAGGDGGAVRGESERRRGDAEREEEGVERREEVEREGEGEDEVDRSGSCEADDERAPSAVREASMLLVIDDADDATLRALDSRLRGSRASSCTSCAGCALVPSGACSSPFSPFPLSFPSRTCTGSLTPHARLTTPRQPWPARSRSRCTRLASARRRSHSARYRS